MMFIPFGGNLAGTLEPGNNFAAWVDSYIVPGRMYQETWDPEGFIVQFLQLLLELQNDLWKNDFEY